jgi:hypothetical protein
MRAIDAGRLIKKDLPQCMKAKDAWLGVGQLINEDRYSG